jgi:hypothetical protein
LWSDGSTNSIGNIRSLDTMRVVIKADNYCETTFTIDPKSFVPYKPGPEYNYGSLCGDIAAIDLQVDDFFYGQNATYLWTPWQSNVNENYPVPANSNYYYQVFQPGTFSVAITSANGCIFYDTMRVERKPYVNSSIEIDHDLCNQKMIIKASGGETYLWRDLKRGGIYDYEDTTSMRSYNYDDFNYGSIYNWELIVKAEGFCNWYYLGSLPAKDNFIVGDSVICSGNIGFLYTDSMHGYSFEGGTSINRGSILWSTGDTTSSIIITKGGWYTCTVTYGDCSVTDSHFVEEKPSTSLSLEYADESKKCEGDQTIIKAKFDHAAVQNVYWYNVDYLINDSMAVVSSSKYVQVWVSVSNGCGSYDFIDHKAAPKIAPIFTIDHISNCDTIGGALLTNNLNGFYSNISWKNNADEILAASDSMITAIGGDYRFEARDTNSCAYTELITISDTRTTNQPEPNGGFPQEIYLCEGSASQVYSTVAYASYLWSDGSTDASLSISTPGVYSVTVVGADCIHTYTIEAKQTTIDITFAGDGVWCGNESQEVKVKFNSVPTYKQFNLGASMSDSTFLMNNSTGSYSITYLNNYCINNGTNSGALVSNSIKPILVFDTLCGGKVQLQNFEQFKSFSWELNGFYQSSLAEGNSFYFHVDSTSVPLYHLILKTIDNNNCLTTETIESIFSVKFSPFRGTNITHYGDKSVTYFPCTRTSLLTYIEANHVSTFEWDGGSAYLSPFGDTRYTQWRRIYSPGTYKVTITASKGCRVVKTLEVLPCATSSIKAAESLESTTSGDTIASKLISEVSETILYTPDFTIMPNPTAGSIYLGYEAPEQDVPIRTSVYDMRGQLIRKDEFITVKGNNLFEIDISPDTPPGVYNVIIFDDKNVYSKRFVKI